MPPRFLSRDGGDCIEALTKVDLLWFPRQPHPCDAQSIQRLDVRTAHCRLPRYPI